MKSLFFVSVIFLSSLGSAYATCPYAGKEYPKGAIVNGYVCQANGTWK